MKVLASVSLAQLILQLIGASKTIRNRIPYDTHRERATPESFRHPNRETTLLIASGLALSVAMALLGLGRKQRTDAST